MRLIHGECIKEMDKLINECVKVNMVLTDLPFGITACKFDIKIPLDEMWNKLNLLTNNNTAICFFSTQPFTTDLINSNRKHFRYCWYWIKNQGTNFFHAKRMPIRKLEEVIIFYKSQPTYNLQYSQNHNPTNSAKGLSDGTVYNGINKREYLGGSTNRYPVNILEYKCVNNYNRLHPNEKPVELLEYLIKTYTNKNDIVLDFTMGSGSTGVAAKNLGRNFIGIELDEKYFNIAKNRLIL